MKIFTKIMAALGVAALKTISVAMSITAKIGSILTGPFLVFVIGCSIYCAFTSNWKSLIILAVIAGAVIAFYMVIGVLLGLMDVAGDNMKRHLRA